jgi:SAM-dependent methyltransferase
MSAFSRRLFFEVAYRVGFTPWDHTTPPPELVEVIEGERELPPGRALDLGCGTGNSSIYMAACGWAVTGIDFVVPAVNRARQKAKAKGLDIDFRWGDVTRLSDTGLEGSFNLMLDVGCFHSLDTEAHRLYASELAQFTEAGATYLLFAFSSAPLAGRGPQGVSRDVVARLFESTFELVEARPGTGPGAPNWYTMHRR